MINTIYEILKNYKSKDIYPFHMPGHKRNKSFLNFDLLDLDITEIPEMDNLNHPKGPIFKTHELLAKAFGAEQSYMLVNGSTSGIIAAIATVCKEGDGILIARNSHRSVYSGMLISNAIPYFVLPEITDFYLCASISPQKIKSILCENKNIKAVFITSPTYEGICSDIETIASIVHSFGKILIVDEAHGAHFNFHSFFPKSAVFCGADIVIQSLHKTLPVLTQSSIIHVNGNLVNRSVLKEWLAIVQTSSPSYIFMAVVEYCIKNISQNPSLFDSYVNSLKNTYSYLNSLKNITMLDKSDSSSKIFDFDRGKLVFYSKGIFDKDKVEYIFREKFKIQLELYGVNHFIAMTSVADTPLGFNKLIDSLKFVDEHFKCRNISVNISSTIPHLQLNPKEAFYKDKDIVPLDRSLNEISGTFVIPYPPGVPLVIPGEIITKDIIDTILMYTLNNIPVVGIDKDCIQIIRRN